VLSPRDEGPSMSSPARQAWPRVWPIRGSKLPQVKAQASLRTPKTRPWSAVACYRLSLAKLASPTPKPYRPLVPECEVISART
jgi:hypothetical protein